MLDIYTRIWVELNRASLIHNIVELKRAIQNAYLAPVVKCNAYGHGMIPIARICDERPEVYMLCVAFLSEALSLREAGITKPILVMSYCNDDIAKAVGKQIAIVVDNHEQLYEINRIAARYQDCFDIHIKVDTGLVRRGLLPEEVATFITVARQLPHVRIVGICSHFASVYMPQAPQTAVQIERFNSVVRLVAAAGNTPPLMHIGNSSLVSALGCNMFRVGLGLYGYDPSQFDLDLKPVLNLKSRVVSLRDVSEGVPVGYDGLSTTLRKSRIALVPVGYADGYDMRFSNCCMVRVRDTNVPMLGRVGMNFLAIDVTEVPGISVGDEVLLMGDEPGMRVSDLIAYAGMRNVRELLARLNPDIPRYIV
jgi:alanine racemase